LPRMTYGLEAHDWQGQGATWNTAKENPQTNSGITMPCC
jgi:hypothetical protein